MEQLPQLICVRSQKRTQAEQEIPELSRACSATVYLILACCAHAEHTTNVHDSISLALDPSSKIPILCDCVIVLTYVQDRCGSRAVSYTHLTLPTICSV